MKRKALLIRALAIEVFCSLLIFALASIWIQDRATLIVIGAGTLTMFLALLIFLRKGARLREKETRLLRQEIHSLSEWPYLECRDAYRTPEVASIAETIRHCTVIEEERSRIEDKGDFLKRISKTAFILKRRPFFLLYFQFGEERKEKAIEIIQAAFSHHYIYVKEDGLFLLEDTPTHEKEIILKAQKIIAQLQGDSQDNPTQAFAMVHPYHHASEMTSWVNGVEIDASLYPLESIWKLSRGDIERTEEEQVDIDLLQCVFGSATYLPSQSSYHIKEETRSAGPSFLLISEEGFIDSMDVSLLHESKFHSITYFSSSGNEGFVPSLLEAIHAKGIYFRYIRIEEETIGFVYALIKDDGTLSEEQYQKLEQEFARREKELLVSSYQRLAIQCRHVDRLVFQTSQVHPYKIKNKDICSVIENKVNSGKDGALLFICRTHKDGDASTLWRNVFKRLHYENQLTDFASINENEALLFLDNQHNGKAKSHAIEIMKALHRPFLLKDKIQKIDFAFFYVSYPADFFHPNEALALWRQYLKSPSGQSPFSLGATDGRVLYSCAHHRCNPTENRIQGYLDSSGQLRFLHVLLTKDEPQRTIDFLSHLIRHKRQINQSHIQRIFLEIEPSHIDDGVLETLKGFLKRLPRFRGRILVLAHRRFDYLTRKALGEMKVESIDYEQSNIVRYYASEAILSHAEKGIIFQKDPNTIRLGIPSNQEEAKLAFAIGIDAIFTEICVEEFPKILRKNTLNWN